MYCSLLPHCAVLCKVLSFRSCSSPHVAQRYLHRSPFASHDFCTLSLKFIFNKWLNLIIPVSGISISSSHLLSYMKTPLMSPTFYWSVALMTTFLFVDRCSQLVRCVGYINSRHIISPSLEQWSPAVYEAQTVCLCLFVCSVECLHLCFLSLAVFMRAVDEMSADIMIFGLCPVHLAQYLFVLPDPVNWCISLVSKWPTSPETVSALSLQQK